MSQCNGLALLVYTGDGFAVGDGVAMGDAGGRGMAVGTRGWAGPWDVHRAGVGMSRLPSTAALAPYLLAAIPLAPRPTAGLGFRRVPTRRFVFAGAAPAGSAAAFTRWETFPRSSCLLCGFFSRSPNTHKNEGCLSISLLVFSARSTWPVLELLAWAAPAPPRGSLRCLVMLQPGAADGNSILNGSDDAPRAARLFVPALMPKSWCFAGMS